MTAKEQGVFVTFEGIEGSGKSTQVKLLASALSEQGTPVVSTWEPGGGRICNRIREILLNPEFKEMTAKTELLLYLASRAQHVAEVIKPALERGGVVLCDRYLDSTLAYQGFGRGISLEKIWEIDSWATGGLVPDLTFFLDVPVEEGLKRATAGFADRVEQEDLEFHKRIRHGYLRLAEMHPERMRIIDAERTEPDVQEEIRAIAQEILPRVI